MLKMAVCIKQVPDTTEVKIDPETNTLIRSGVPSIVNPFDKNALEAALALRDAEGGSVTVLCMGPPQAGEALRECLAAGADEACLLSDRAFGGADTLATSYTLAAAVRKLGGFDIIFCGKQAIDGDTAQVGPELAEHLGLPQVTYLSSITVKDGIATCHKEQEDGHERIECALPMVASVVKGIGTLRYGTVKARIAATARQLDVLTAADLEVEAERLGLKGSPTLVDHIFSPPKRAVGTRLDQEEAGQVAGLLVDMIEDAGLLA